MTAKDGDMAASWTKDSVAALEVIGQAYGSREPSRLEMARREPTIVRFTEDELRLLQARLDDAKASFDVDRRRT